MLVADAATGLRARALDLADRYEELAARAKVAAVRWSWATPSSGHGDVEPLRLQRMGCSPGELLHQRPPARREHEMIGYDELGRVVCVRQYDDTGAVWLERFASWSEVAVEVACFRAPLDFGSEPLPAKLQSVLAMRLAGGLPADSERILPPTGSCARERYRHENGRLVRVEEDSCDEAGALVTVVKEVLYDDDGHVIGVDRLGPDGRRSVWRRDEPRRESAPVLYRRRAACVP
jgi:hypothetical protein